MCEHIVGVALGAAELLVINLITTGDGFAPRHAQREGHLLYVLSLGMGPRAKLDPSRIRPAWASPASSLLGAPHHPLRAWPRSRCLGVG